MKKYLIIALVGLTILFVIGVLLLRSQQGRNQGSGNTPSVSNVPDYILSETEESKMRTFVKNFTDLYNTYSFEDTKSALNIGTYASVPLQEQMVERIEAIEANLKPGYSITTETDGAQLTYAYPEANRIIVQIPGRVTERQGGFSAGYDINAHLTILYDSKSFVVDSIEISKQ